MTHLLLTWGYPALFLATLLAAMGLPTGSEIVIGYAGALASGHLGGGSRHLDLALVIVLASLAEVIGAFVGYSIGRVGGRPLVERVGRYVLVTKADLDRAERLFARRGEPVVFFGRFVPLLRSFIGIAAGLAEMSVAKFAVFTALAGAIWVSAFAVAGDALGSSWDRVLHNVTDVGYLIAAALVLGAAALLWKRFRAVRDERSVDLAGGVNRLDPEAP